MSGVTKFVNGRTVLASIVVSSLTAANVAASKVAELSVPLLDSVTMPAGFVGIAIAFLATDLLSEVYGRDAARSAVNGAIVSLGVAWGVIYSAIMLPAAPFYPFATEFAAIMGQGASIVLASIVTLLVSQNTDVSLFHFIKERVPYKWARNVGSTALSQAIDTSVFIALGFVAFPALFGGNPMAWGAAGALMFGQYLVKLGIVVVDTPLFYVLSAVMSDG